MMFRFAYPVMFVLLAGVVGWMLYIFWKKPVGVTHSITGRLAELAGRRSGARQLVLPAVRAACLILLVLTAARPQVYNVSREIRSPGVDIIMCLDTSGSMRALDFKLDDKPVTRLTAVKKVVGEFIKKREVDRIGLVVFGEEAFTQAPLTLDKGLLLGLVDKMTIGMAGDRTAIGSALAIAGKRLKDLKAASKILILLTDGRHNAGELTPEQAAEAVRALGVKIYTIGVGGRGPAPFQVQSLFGTRIVHRQVDLDEATLKKIADIGGGKYFRAADTEGLAEIYDIIDGAEKTEVKVKEFFHFRELYPYFLIPALVLLGLEILLKTTVLRTVP
jgi:Ca-activated chloride channel family protein